MITHNLKFFHSKQFYKIPKLEHFIFYFEILRNDVTLKV